MTDESANNELNGSNMDTFIKHKESKPAIIKKSSELRRIDTRQTVMMEERIEENTLDDLGKIEEAKKHRSANRPLHKIKDFNSNVNFCRCCNLPCEEKGIIEPFKFCDNIDNFAECGLGVSLYFYFFQFASVVIFVGICVLAISMMVFNHHYTKGINRVCNNNYRKLNRNDLIFCEGFITAANQSLNIYNRFNDWILRFTSDNVEVYQLLHDNITSNSKNTKHVLINYSILNFCLLLTIFILNIFYLIFIAANSQKAKLLNFSIRDYTVLIANAKHILVEYLDTKQRENPKFLKNSQQLVENTADFINYVNEYIRSDRSLTDLKINNINMCYNLGNYIDLRDEYEKCIKKIFRIKNDPKIIELNLKEGNLFQNRCYYNIPLSFIGINCIYFKGKPLITLQKQKSDLEKQIEFEVENIQLITENNFTGYMFISFNRIKDKEIILNRYPNNFFDMIIYFFKNIKYYLCCCCLSKGEEIKISKIKGIDVDDPPEPEDLYWENFKYTSRQRVLRIILVFFLCLIIIGLSFLLVLGFTVVQNKYIENDKDINLFVKYLLSLIITIIISVLNAVLEVVLTKFTLVERHLSRTNSYLSLSIKMTILTFFNSAIVPLWSKQIIVKKKVMYDYNIDRNILLVNDMFILFVVNAIVTPLFWTFNVPYLFKKFRIWLLERKKEPDKNHYMTQKELNKLYELPDMKISYKYSYIAKTLAMTLFYLPIFPMGFIISFIGFIFGYLLELYNFTHLYKRPDMLDEIITKYYADYFIIILFIGSIGDYFFFYDIFPNNKMSLANIIIFGVLIIIPYTKFINCNFVGIDKSEYHNFPLSEVYFTFYNDYQRQNPFTKKVGLLNYLTELKKNGYLSNNAYHIAEKNIENLNLMEIYYGITRGNIPIVTQSVMANTNNRKSIAGQNIRQSVVAPNIRDDMREKVKKQKYFDSQIIHMFSSKNSRKFDYPIDFPMDTIIEEDEDKAQTKDKLINAYNNPLAINMGLGPLPLDVNIYSSIPLTKSFNKLDTKEVNIFKNNLKYSRYLDEKKNKNKDTDIDYIKSKSDYITPKYKSKKKEVEKKNDEDIYLGVSENRMSNTSSKLEDIKESKNLMQFHSSKSSNLDLDTKSYGMRQNNSNQFQVQDQNQINNVPQNQYNEDESEEEKNNDMPYKSNIGTNNGIPYNSSSNIINNTDMESNSNLGNKNDININDESNIQIPQCDENNIPYNSSILENNNNENDNQNDKSNYDNTNNNYNGIDITNNSQKNSLNNQNNNDINNDTQSINDDNLNALFNTSSKPEKNNTNIIQDTSRQNDKIPLGEESIKDNNMNNNDINENSNDIKLSQGINNNNNNDNQDIMDEHNFPYNNENNEYNNENNENNYNIEDNNENNNIVNVNEEEGNEPENNDKGFNSTLSNNFSNEKGNDDFI